MKRTVVIFLLVVGLVTNFYSFVSACSVCGDETVTFEELERLEFFKNKDLEAEVVLTSISELIVSTLIHSCVHQEKEDGCSKVDSVAAGNEPLKLAKEKLELFLCQEINSNIAFSTTLPLELGDDNKRHALIRWAIDRAFILLSYKNYVIMPKQHSPANIWRKTPTLNKGMAIASCLSMPFIAFASIVIACKMR